jgi:hypothetical protein
MIAYVLGVVGIICGIWTAKKRNGNWLDMAQYSIGFGLAFFLLTYLFLLILNAIL